MFHPCSLGILWFAYKPAMCSTTYALPFSHLLFLNLPYTYIAIVDISNDFASSTFGIYNILPNKAIFSVV